MEKVDVIIPVYKPTKKFVRLLKMLSKQTVKPDKIIVINTEQKYFDKFFYGTALLEKYDNLIVKHISRYEFDHGATRRMGVSISQNPYFICMTDDAVPMDIYLIENLIKPLVEGKAASSFARQCVSDKCSDVERFTRKFNYPEESFYKSKKDIKKLGIKTYFCSNVCAAYSRKVYDELGGFEKSTIFNEDMIYAASVIKAGYSIYYSSEAQVLHHHNYNNIQQLRRNFDLGVSQAKHPEVFDDVPSTTEGKRMVRETTKYLKSKGKSGRILSMYVTSGYKYIGYQLGKHYKLLPKWLIKKVTMNQVYWDKIDGEI